MKISKQSQTLKTTQVSKDAPSETTADSKAPSSATVEAAKTTAKGAIYAARIQARYRLLGAVMVPLASAAIGMYFVDTDTEPVVDPDNEIDHDVSISPDGSQATRQLSSEPSSAALDQASTDEQGSSKNVPSAQPEDFKERKRSATRQRQPSNIHPTSKTPEPKESKTPETQDPNFQSGRKIRRGDSRGGRKLTSNSNSESKTNTEDTRKTTCPGSQLKARWCSGRLNRSKKCTEEVFPSELKKELDALCKKKKENAFVASNTFFCERSRENKREYLLAGFIRGSDEFSHLGKFRGELSRECTKQNETRGKLFEHPKHGSPSESDMQMPLKGSYFNHSCLLLLTLAASNCRIIPPQMVRVVHMERYTQSYSALADLRANCALGVFKTLLGSEHYRLIQEFNDRAEGSNRISKTLLDKVQIHGSVAMTFSLIPDIEQLKSKNIRFVLEGFGSYRLTYHDDVVGESSRLVAPFEIIPQTISIDELNRQKSEKGVATIGVKIAHTVIEQMPGHGVEVPPSPDLPPADISNPDEHEREHERLSRFQKAEARRHIEFHNRRTSIRAPLPGSFIIEIQLQQPDDGLYRINYEAEHRLLALNVPGCQKTKIDSESSKSDDNVIVFGYHKFEPPEDGRAKIIDTTRRGIRFIKAYQ